MSDGLEHGLGLALGGGGARGLAHIPALEALDELGVRPARIAGTSIGAIFGAAYAAGMSGAEIREHTLEVLGDPTRVARKLMELRPRRFREIFQRGALMPTQFDACRIIDLFLPKRIGADFPRWRFRSRSSPRIFIPGANANLPRARCGRQSPPQSHCRRCFARCG